MDRLRFIQGAQRLGLKLRDIKDLLAIRDTGVCPCEPAEELLRRRLAELDAEMVRAECAARADGVHGEGLADEELPTAAARRPGSRTILLRGGEIAMIETNVWCDCDQECTDPNCGC